MKGGDNLNKAKLESFMKLFHDTGETLSKYLDIARSTFSAKINETNGAEFTQGEIMAIKRRYNLSPQDLIDIFFTEEVSKIDT